MNKEIQSKGEGVSETDTIQGVDGEINDLQKPYMQPYLDYDLVRDVLAAAQLPLSTRTNVNDGLAYGPQVELVMRLFDAIGALKYPSSGLPDEKLFRTPDAAKNLIQRAANRKK